MSPRPITGIEHNPIYVVSTEADVWSVSEDDYIDGAEMRDLLAGLRNGEHLYLVHLGEGGLTRLA